MAVDPALQGKGYGRKLMEALEAEAPRAETAFLEVRRDNVAGIAMYDRLGYAIIGTRTRYYEDGCDALVLRKGRPPPAARPP